MKVLHLRTSSRLADELVEAWLRQHGADAIRCPDACQACLAALKYRDEPVELAFVGTRWLTADELRIVGYLRAAWPRVGVVLVAEPGEQVLAPWPRTVVCNGTPALRRLLTSAPAELSARLGRIAEPIRRGAGRQTPQDVAWLDSRQRSLETELPVEIVAEPQDGADGTDQRTPDEPPASKPGVDGEQDRAVDVPPEPRPRASDAALTPEEVAALLKDDQ